MFYGLPRPLRVSNACTGIFERSCTHFRADRGRLTGLDLHQEGFALFWKCLLIPVCMELLFEVQILTGIPHFHSSYSCYSHVVLCSSWILLLPIKAYAEVRVEIRGGTPLPTRKYGKAYAQVRNAIRGGTRSREAFPKSIVERFLRGSTVQPQMTICRTCVLGPSGRRRTVGQNGCVFPTRKYGGIAPPKRSMSLRGSTVERRLSLFLKQAG